MAKLNEVWDLIQKDYLQSPTTHGLQKQLADKYEVSYPALRQKISQSGLKESRERLKENLPIRRALRTELAKATAEYAVEPIKTFREAIQQKTEEYLGRADKRLGVLETNLDDFIEKNPSKISDALNLNETLDSQVRKLYGMSTGEEVDPHKRGIAMLAYGVLPPMVQANARLVE